MPAEDVWYGLHVFGDDILYTFDRHDDPGREYWRMNRCTGVVEPYPALTPGLHNPYLVNTLNGPVLYANDADARPYIVDRWDEPGADEARPVPGLPTSVVFGPNGPVKRVADFFVFGTWSGSGKTLFHAAGVGARTYAIYKHGGDPEAPAVLLSDRLIHAYFYDETHSLILEDSGEVHRVDELTGERELVQTGVRSLDYGDGQRSFIWQAMGDDSVEPVFLHDLATGQDVQIAINDFAAASWNRGETTDAGEWVYSDHTNPAAAAMIGPDDRFVAAVRLDTGEAIAIPEHLKQHGSTWGYLRLLLATDAGEVEALWDPRTGAVREWYSGPEKRPLLLRLDGDRLEYFLPGDEEYWVGSYWRLDLANGEAVRLLTDVAPFPLKINEHQYLVEHVRAGLDGPPSGDLGGPSHDLSDYVLVDVDSGVSTPIAERVSGRAIVYDEGMMFVDAFAPEPGLMAHPLPFDGFRVGPRADVLPWRFEPRHLVSAAQGGTPRTRPWHAARAASQTGPKDRIGRHRQGSKSTRSGPLAVGATPVLPGDRVE